MIQKISNIKVMVGLDFVTNTLNSLAAILLIIKI